ncbi:hypothetical protein JW868_03515, partial [Candidatus Woesearchaeota archaeon]|nr:hypothetical protein [Candidatus Woesearchaeota archaeon]
ACQENGVGEASKALKTKKDTQLTADMLDKYEKDEPKEAPGEVCLEADYTGDRIVDLADFARFGYYYSIEHPLANLNHDEQVSLADFAVFAWYYGDCDWRERLPDLIVTDIYLVPENPAPFETFDVHVIVKNIGNTTANYSQVHMDYEWNHSNTTAAVPPLNPGEEYDIELFAAGYVEEAGEYFVSANADHYDEVVELIENNNYYWENIVVLEGNGTNYTHSECTISDQCVEVSGWGPNECNDNADCTRFHVVDSLEAGESHGYWALDNYYDVIVVFISTNPLETMFSVNGVFTDTMGIGDDDLLEGGALIEVIDIVANDNNGIVAFGLNGTANETGNESDLQLDTWLYVFNGTNGTQFNVSAHAWNTMPPSNITIWYYVQHPLNPTGWYQMGHTNCANNNCWGDSNPFYMNETGNYTWRIHAADSLGGQVTEYEYYTIW